MDKTKAAHDDKIYLELKYHLTRYVEEFALLCDISLFLLKSSIYVFGSKSNLHNYSQSDHYQFNLSDIHSFYSIYFLC